MNNYISLIFCLISNSLFASLYSNQIPFTGSDVLIIGQFAELNINEGLGGEIDIKFEKTNNDVASYSIKTEKGTTIIELLETVIFSISVPPTTNVSCAPDQVVSEDWYQNQNNLKISLNNLKGEVVIDSDGYDIKLIDVMGPTSIVTYGNIEAVYHSAPVSEIISLDTYQGSINVQVPGGHAFSADDIEYVAKSNMLITKKGELKFSNNLCTMKLHSESGKKVSIITISDPTHPEYRDKLIKLFIRDQGKNGMSTGSKAELFELGYGDYINQQPDIRPFTGNTLAKELVALIGENGFPTPEMVGEGYAMRGAAIVLFNSSIEYMDKYKSEFIDHFGQTLSDIYYNRYSK